MNISFTTFIDFVMATPGAKVTVVREARDMYNEGYKHWRDFHKDLREGIISMHRHGRGRADLDRVVAVADERHADNFRPCVVGYAKWMGRKKFMWVKTPSVLPWRSGELEVAVNPELQLAIDGKPHAVKLYFKDAKLEKTRVNSMLHLLRLAVPDRNTEIGILDVRRGRLVAPTREVSNVDLLVQGEAASFAAIWRGLDPPALSAAPPVS